MTINSRNGFIFGYAFGFKQKANYSTIQISEVDGSGLFTVNGISKYVPPKNMKRYTFIESLETHDKCVNIKGKWYFAI